MDALRPDAERVLRALVGREDAELRDDQWAAIEALVVGRRRVLVVQRTGWGKSAVYFVATALLRSRGSGPTVIVSPLLALMRDQIAAAARAGIRAMTINSANVAEWEQVHAAVARGDVDVLLCSPERLNNPGFREEVLPRLARDAGLVVIDEAHCISDWGHDFRPDYRRIRDLLAGLPPGIGVLATTATANARVTRDVADQLARQDEEVLVLRGALDRPSLHLGVVRLPDQARRLAWLAENLTDLAGSGSGIVYCLTVAAAEDVARALRSAGHDARAYTGRTEPVERETLEADLKDNRVTALVATSALGMGFDKPDLGFVVHLGAPPSPIAYYQQVGRAGRAVARAVVVLLPGEEDRGIWDYFGSLAFPGEREVRAVLAALADGETMSTATLETIVDLRRARLETMLKVLDVDGAVRRVRGGWRSTGEPWVYDAERYARVDEARRAEQRSMLAYESTEGCRMAFLRADLDDPLLEPDWRCGRCDTCGGLELPRVPSTSVVVDVRSGLERPGVEIAPRAQWPSGMRRLGVDLAGRIPDGERPDVGRALARLDALGWAGPLRELLAPGAPDAPLPEALRRPMVEVLDDWAPVADGVVAVASATRPRLVDHLAAGVARRLGLRVVGRVAPRPDRPPCRHDVNSAQRLHSVLDRMHLDLGEAALAGLPGRSVLLVDDYVDSGWTLTVAARLLRQAGASRVLAVVLAQR